jgi:methylmalonyl-CoA mutase
MNFFMEIAKLRAARMLWHELMRVFEPQDPRSLMLRTHCQTSGYSLTAQDPYNNIVRTTIEALAAVLGGTQSLHTNSFDEALALPSNLSSRIARNTQLILQHETDVTATVDPLGGSYFIESLTHELASKARDILGEVEAMGGMVSAIESGMPKMRIEEAAAKKQALIDARRQVIVGVNKFQAGESDSTVQTLEVDNSTVRAAQIARLEAVKRTRDSAKCESALAALRQGARIDENLLALTIEAIRARATVGEVSATLADVFGRYTATTQLVNSVYSSSYGDEMGLAEARRACAEFTQTEGRRPRILIVKLGQDGHDRGSKVIATGLADVGFDVDVGPLFQTPEEAAKQAIENDVHVIGVSSQAGAHKTLVPELVQVLRSSGAGDVLVIAGGIIPEKDYSLLKEAGTAEIFGPGTPVPDCALRILKVLAASRSKP